MAARVSLSRCVGYDKQTVLAALRENLERLGGMGAFVKPGQRVLLKPNLLRPEAPERCVTTHPSVVWAVAKLAQEAGGEVSVGDSTGFGSGVKAMHRSGIWNVAQELGLEIAGFTESTEVHVSRGHTFRQLEIARDVLSADVVINLPKVKTHGQMYLTLAVKNLFGCVAGVRKAQWHVKAGFDAHYFARLLLDVYVGVSPALTVLDGVVSMEGNGPGGGDPKETGFLLAGQDAVALDRVVCALLGLPAGHLPTHVEAERLGIGETRLDRIAVLGVPVERMRVTGFKPSNGGPLNRLVLAPLLRTPLRDGVLSRPLVLHDRCKQCGECIAACPVGAMRLRPADRDHGPQRVTVDYPACIRCFCCQEICPKGAIVVESGWLLSRYRRLRQRAAEEDALGRG